MRERCGGDLRALTDGSGEEIKAADWLFPTYSFFIVHLHLLLFLSRTSYERAAWFRLYRSSRVWLTAGELVW